MDWKRLQMSAEIHCYVIYTNVVIENAIMVPANTVKPPTQRHCTDLFEPEWIYILCCTIMVVVGTGEHSGTPCSVSMYVQYFHHCTISNSAVVMSCSMRSKANILFSVRVFILDTFVKYVWMVGLDIHLSVIFLLLRRETIIYVDTLLLNTEVK